jgi:hypothetical protein
MENEKQIKRNIMDKEQKTNNQTQKTIANTLGQKIIFWALWFITVYSLTVLAGSFIVSKIMHCS